MASIIWRSRQRKWYTYFYDSTGTKRGRPLPESVPRREKLNKTERKSAELIAEQIASEHQTVSPDHIDVETAAAYWLDDCRIGLSKATWDSYRSRIKMFVRWVAKAERLPIRNIDGHMVRKWRNHRMDKVNQNTARNDMKAIVAFFAWCVREGHIDQNPAATVIIPKREYREAMVAQTHEVSRMLSMLDNPGLEPAFRALGIMGALCGMRRSEILLLHWMDINLESGFLRIVRSKSRNPRNVPMCKTVREFILDIPQSGELVFPGVYKSGQVTRSPDVARRFNAWLIKNGFAWSHKALRHWCNDQLRLMGLESVARRHIIGHTSDAVNRLYCHPDAEEARPYLSRLESHVSDLLSIPPGTD